jgi:hypothetical protein
MAKSHRSVKKRSTFKRRRRVGDPLKASMRQMVKSKQHQKPGYLRSA